MEKSPCLADVLGRMCCSDCAEYGRKITDMLVSIDVFDGNALSVALARQVASVKKRKRGGGDRLIMLLKAYGLDLYSENLNIRSLHEYVFLLATLSVCEQEGFHFSDYRIALDFVKDIYQRIHPFSVRTRLSDNKLFVKMYLDNVKSLFRLFRLHRGCECLQGTGSTPCHSEVFITAVDLFGSSRGSIRPCQAVRLSEAICRKRIPLDSVSSFLNVFGVARVDDLIALLTNSMTTSAVASSIIEYPAVFSPLQYRQIESHLTSWANIRGRKASFSEYVDGLRR